jgi:hypothetical protein
MQPTLRASKPAVIHVNGLLSEPLKPALPYQPRRLLCLFSALLLTFTAVLAHAQDYTSIVVFGDSLSDTGNVADLTYAKYGVRIPGPYADYSDGRFTDGDDTIPAARKYFGVWIEQFAAMLPAKPIISNSLNGGTDYAYGFGTTGSGTGLCRTEISGGQATFRAGGSFRIDIDRQRLEQKDLQRLRKALATRGANCQPATFTPARCFS